SLSADEQRIFRLYGKLPTNSDHLKDHLKERKYFDSGDYALCKVGNASPFGTESVSTLHPLPENIPHLFSPSVSIASQGGSGNSNLHPGVAGGCQTACPVKMSSFLTRERSVDEVDDKD
ncbi:hypothetical protein B0O99DRAFT_492500, partial [Bisporella sp. PMI_857]